MTNVSPLKRLLYITGKYKNQITNSWDVCISKMDNNGNALWYKIYGGFDNEEGLAIQKTSDNGYIITGTRIYDSGSKDILLIKVDNNGNPIF